ncbi:hypothetical protein [Methanocella conradii]|uniref:hypothetical protein n=1 Tax=Methanocella conradii TaxID=1175444 RepID=UPI0024B38B40|nr:hypothetical protein [Methanocella conradii]MDI6897290.1 hypothetical protein [Methanocella conradii]
MSIKLGEVYNNSAIEDFGSALRKDLRENEDYASLIELENVEKPEEFAEVIKKFLRRYESYARKKQRKRPEEKSLMELMQLVDTYGVRVVRAALISHALVKSSKPEEGVE